MEEVVTHFVEKLAGPEAENAWHSLRELGPAALPAIIAAFATVQDPDIQVALVQLVGESRSPAGLPFLMAHLHDDRPEIWKAALDGLVTLGGDEVLNHLAAARAHVEPVRVTWLEEAIQQISDAERDLLR